MQTNTSAKSAPRQPRSLWGSTAWLITDGKPAMDVQVRGVAEALGVDYAMKRIDPKGIFRFLAPWGPVAPAERFGEPQSLFAPPWPQLAIATGRVSIPYIRALKRRAGDATYTIVLQDPRSGLGTADLLCIPAHDRLRGPNVFTTLTSPHSFSPSRLAELRQSMPGAIAALPAPRVAVLLGGKNKVYEFTEADDLRFSRALTSIAALGASFMITPSRRTHQQLRRVADEATRGAPRIFWDLDQHGPNPYAEFLAHADFLIVTADSVNMTGEACATGRPVFVFEPSRGSKKFKRFHQSLQDYGATRPLPGHLDALVGWDYTPIDSATILAREIEARYLARKM